MISIRHTGMQACMHEARHWRHIYTDRSRDSSTLSLLPLIIFTHSIKVPQGAPFTATIISPGRIGGLHFIAGFSAPAGSSLNRCTTVRPSGPFEISKPIPCGPFTTVVFTLLDPGRLARLAVAGCCCVTGFDAAEEAFATGGGFAAGVVIGANFDLIADSVGAPIGAYLDFAFVSLESVKEEPAVGTP